MAHLCARVIPDFSFLIKRLCMNLTKCSTCKGKLQADDMIKKLLDDPAKAGKISVLQLRKRQKKKKCYEDKRHKRIEASCFQLHSLQPSSSALPQSCIKDLWLLHIKRSIISLKTIFPRSFSFYLRLYLLDSSARMESARIHVCFQKHQHQMNQCNLWRAEHC